MLLLASVRTELDWALAGAALFLVLYGVLRGVVGRSWSPRIAVPWPRPSPWRRWWRRAATG